MGYTGLEGGTPVVMTGTPSSGDLFGGSGGFGGFLLGALLSGGTGLFGGMNRGWGYGGMGYGAGYPGYGGFYAGNVEGGQTGGISAIQNQVSNLTSKVDNMQITNEIDELETAVSSGFANAATANCAGFADVQSSLASIGRDYNNLFGQVNQNIANANFTTLNSINNLGRDVMGAMSSQALQQLNSFNVLTGTMQQGLNNVNSNMNQSFNSLNTNILQGFNEVGKDMNIATSQIIAGQTAAAAQMAACCCDIKQAIATDGGLTRALINDIRLAELNAQLTDAKVKVSNLEQTNALVANNAAQTSVILQHIAPLFQGCHSEDRRSA